MKRYQTYKIKEKENPIYIFNLYDMCRCNYVRVFLYIFICTYECVCACICLYKEKLLMDPLSTIISGYLEAWNSENKKENTRNWL